MNLEDLYDLIDELLTIDMVTDAELGMHVREWYEKENNPNLEDSDDDMDWSNLEDNEFEGTWEDDWV